MQIYGFSSDISLSYGSKILRGVNLLAMAFEPECRGHKVCVDECKVVFAGGDVRRHEAAAATAVCARIFHKMRIILVCVQNCLYFCRRLEQEKGK